ncbi:MAG: hypothetical protein OER86_05635 [Phycisphaerae bacterium]|nr:hypothetical protein [Phycisphaerae bacterium]
MFKKDRASASGSSSTRIWAQHAAGKVKLLGRGQLIAGEDCVLRVEFEAHKKPPAGVHFRARPYLGNADITVRDLWGRTVPMTALGEKVVVAADKHARRLKPIVPDSETEFQVDLTGWWQLSRPGTYMIDIQWPIFNSTGTQTGQIEARRYVFEVRER